MTKALIAAGAGITLLVMLAAITGAVAGSMPSTAGAGYQPSSLATDAIPPEALALYQAAAAQEGLDWTVLAGIGKVETNHCQSTLPGVHSGANYAGAMGCMQFLASSWTTYGDGGSPYELADAIPAAARYLKAAGAPADYHRAVLAYNHSEEYVAEVMGWAERYRGNGGLGTTVPVALPDGATWLAPVPGTGVVCDRRIVPDVVWILATYRAHAGDCYAASGHASAGEHPLGLGIDLHPGPGGSWQLLDKLARDLGWRESCSATGCAEEAFIRPFRFIGWNNYPGHGDPAHAGGNAHLHLSWGHSGGVPAASVYTLRR
jgi:hypothetical protein